jgi:serine/threonine protein phosphatase 1
MRLLAIGDIHGTLHALDTLLGAVDLQSDDLLITLGDYVDRGPDTRGVLDRLIELNGTGQLIALRGNHDELMLHARLGLDQRMWLTYGGKNTLASYGIPSLGEEQLGKVPDSHWHFLESVCRDYYETDTHFFVHGNVFPDVPLAEQPTHVLYWEKLFPFDSRPHISGKIMVCGHTKQPEGQPLDLGHAICIDTGAYEARGWLTCLEVPTDRYWQANQEGQLRMGLLSRARSEAE